MSEIALLFPGQGAQHPGMAQDVVDRYPAAAQVFETADRALGMDLCRICSEGPQQKLARTDLCQPAVLATSVVLLRALEECEGHAIDASATAGLSLGEYTALVAAEALNLEDALRLVYRRGQFMQEACDTRPGTMYSIIGLRPESVERICDEVRSEGGEVWPANYNSPSQVVISGEREGAARAAELCEEREARRAIQLEVAGAFHSPLMEPAAEKLERELEKLDFREPSLPVVSNVTGETGAPAENIPSLLTRQLTSPVLWQKGMQTLIERGAGRFYEVGPGRVLKGLLRRIDRDVDCRSVGSAEHVEQAAGEIAKTD